jgi:hypothetical protein
LKERSSVREEKKRYATTIVEEDIMDKIHSLDTDKTRKTLEEQGRKRGLENASLARTFAVRVWDVMF